MEVWLVRHGETEQNASGRVQGQGHGTLSSRGKKQVETVAKKLAKEKFAAIYTSDLGRCVETAKGIHAYHLKTPLIMRTELREFKFGVFQGFPAKWFWWARGLGHYFGNVRIPGFDSAKSVRERVVPFLNHVQKKHKNDKILVVSHGGPIRIIRAVAEGRSFKELLNEDIPNCSVWPLKIDKPLE
jgi:broad specificity phosphatase PhoE